MEDPAYEGVFYGKIIQILHLSRSPYGLDIIWLGQNIETETNQ